MSTLWERVARRSAGDDYAETYAARFRTLAARGNDVHGEAGFVAGLVTPPATVLDAGCGTGRVAVRLAELGYDVVGCDVDPTMVGVARRDAPDLDWRVADLATLDLGQRFDVVLLAGNVVPFLEPGTLAAACARLAAHVAPGGLLVCGFGTDADHVPAGCPVVPPSAFESATESAGLVERARSGTWDGDPYDAADGYLVTVHGLVG